jgi:hypothetical protein
LSCVLAAIPVVGVVELALHVKQASDAPSDADWEAAKAAIAGEVGPDDLVVFAPFWADPVGRAHFGDALAGVRREARPDESRYARAFEVAIRGAHRDELRGWKRLSERSVGRFTIGVYENPSFSKPKVDLVELVGPDRASVARVDAAGAEQPCSWARGAGQPGGLGVPQGPAVPGERFTCPGGGYVGVAVLHAMDHHPHMCIFASPPGPNAAIKITFKGVPFGEAIHGHSGVQWVDDRNATGEKVALSFSAFGRPIGANPHRTGAGWAGFEFPTPELAGRRGDLVAEITGSQPHYCFEADIR